MLVKNGAILATALSALSLVEAKRQTLNERGTRCNGDNLLNRFRDNRYSVAAASFCQTFINSVSYSVVTVSTDAAHVSSPVTTYSTVYPTPLITTSYPATRLSSACSCISVSKTTSVVTEYVASTTEDATTTPTDDSSPTATDDSWPTVTADSSPTATADSSPTATADSSPTATADSSPTATDDSSPTATDDSSPTATDDSSPTATDDSSPTATDGSSPTATDDSSPTATDGSSPTATDDPTTATTTGSTPASTDPAAAVALGCYSEGRYGRALSVDYVSASDQVDMTVEKCASLCSGYAYYGVEYAGECYCGDEISNGAFLFVDQSVCNLPCNGNSAETCGGYSALNIYGPAQAPAPLPTVPEFEFLGCYDDSIRVLTQRYISQAMMTPEYCFLTCTQAGYGYAGVEYGYECWCGVSASSADHELLSGSCNEACPGNATETCGGFNALQLYQALSS